MALIRPSAEACAEFLHPRGAGAAGAAAAPCIKALTRAIDAAEVTRRALDESDDDRDVGV